MRKAAACRKIFTKLPRIIGLAASISIAFLILALVSSADLFFQPIDLGVWINDINRLQQCLTEMPMKQCSNISKFPVAYLINSAIAQPLQAENGDPRAGLQILQAASLCLPITGFFVLHKSLKTGLKLSGIYLVLLLLTPLPTLYISSASLEIQAGVFLGLAIIFGMANLKTPRSSDELLSNIFVFVGCLYKDTLSITFFVCLLITKILTRSRSPSWISVLRTWAPGLIVAILTSAAWNSLRYHSLAPLGYLEEAYFNKPSVAQILTSLWALYLSPNGGLVVFWGTVLGILLLVKSLKQQWRLFPPSFGELFPLAFMLIGISSMAFWWAPFGWVSWGARLSIPFVLSTIVYEISILRFPSEQQVNEIKPRNARIKPIRVFLVALSILLIAVSAPYISLGYTRSRFSLFPENNPALAVGIPKACTANMFREMGDQQDPHPNPGVRMWRSSTYWHCIRIGMEYNPVNLITPKSQGNTSR